MVLYLYLSTIRKKKMQRWGKEEAAGSLQSSQKLKRAGTGGRWECTTGVSPKSEITDAERMKQCKLIKDKSVCCQPVLGGFECGTGSLRFRWFLGKCWAAAGLRLCIKHGNKQNSSGKNDEKPPGTLLCGVNFTLTQMNSVSGDCSTGLKCLQNEGQLVTLRLRISVSSLRLGLRRI